MSMVMTGAPMNVDVQDGSFSRELRNSGYAYAGRESVGSAL